MLLLLLQMMRVSLGRTTILLLQMTRGSSHLLLRISRWWSSHLLLPLLLRRRRSSLLLIGTSPRLLLRLIPWHTPSARWLLLLRLLGLLSFGLPRLGRHLLPRLRLLRLRRMMPPLLPLLLTLRPQLLLLLLLLRRRLALLRGLPRKLPRRRLLRLLRRRLLRLLLLPRRGRLLPSVRMDPAGLRHDVLLPRARGGVDAVLGCLPITLRPEIARVGYARGG
mmetsp:Transcript_22060/g.47739  ORF Transcript_22060/g.47739 Transcript_22060/m.47739 type:complete len:221 (-) Transcript_22060:1029-1691(-)